MTTQLAIERVKLNLGAMKGLNSKIELNEEDLGNIIQMSLDELVDKVVGVAAAGRAVQANESGSADHEDPGYHFHL